MARPGIVLYFDFLEPIRVLPDADKGRLLVAILEYGKEGKVPQFDGMLALAWGFIRPKLDRDSEEYEKTILKRQYATFCREIKRKGLPDVDFDDWLMMTDDEKCQLLSCDTTRHLTITKTQTQTETGTATVAEAETKTETPSEDLAAAAADRKLKLMGGELGRGVVSLSEYQIDLLLDKMGVEMFDHYVAKLANFIIKNDAKVKGHYSTILKWWTQDMGI